MAGPTTQAGPDTQGTPEVQVRRSRRRRRTISAHREGEVVVVDVPASLTAAEERHWVALMLERLARREARLIPSDARLAVRAQELSDRYLGGRAVPRSVRWSDRQQQRWGSCTPEDAAIRLSSRLQGVPGFVLDYVLLHELTHLLVPDHSPRFWAELAGFPHLDRARGFLEGLDHAAVRGVSGPDQAEQAD